jgi:hypothetical protein
MGFGLHELGREGGREGGKGGEREGEREVGREGGEDRCLLFQWASPVLSSAYPCCTLPLQDVASELVMAFPCIAI